MNFTRKFQPYLKAVNLISPFHVVDHGNLEKFQNICENLSIIMGSNELTWSLPIFRNEKISGMHHYDRQWSIRREESGLHSDAALPSFILGRFIHRSTTFRSHRDPMALRHFWPLAGILVLQKLIFMTRVQREKIFPLWKCPSFCVSTSRGWKFINIIVWYKIYVLEWRRARNDIRLMYCDFQFGLKRQK